jgi:hypothetical protein
VNNRLEGNALASIAAVTEAKGKEKMEERGAGSVEKRPSLARERAANPVLNLPLGNLCFAHLAVCAIGNPFPIWSWCSTQMKG